GGTALQRRPAHVQPHSARGDAHGGGANNPWHRYRALGTGGHRRAGRRRHRSLRLLAPCRISRAPDTPPALDQPRVPERRRLGGIVPRSAIAAGRRPAQVFLLSGLYGRHGWPAARRRPDRPARLGVSPEWLQRLQDGARLVYVFCYPDSPQNALVQALAGAAPDTLILAPEGVWHAGSAPHEGTGSASKVGVHAHAFVDQETF